MGAQFDSVITAMPHPVVNCTHEVVVGHTVVVVGSTAALVHPQGTSIAAVKRKEVGDQNHVSKKTGFRPQRHTIGKSSINNCAVCGAADCGGDGLRWSECARFRERGDDIDSRFDGRCNGAVSGMVKTRYGKEEEISTVKYSRITHPVARTTSDRRYFMLPDSECLA